MRTAVVRQHGLPLTTRCRMSAWVQSAVAMPNRSAYARAWAASVTATWWRIGQAEPVLDRRIGGRRRGRGWRHRPDDLEPTAARGRRRGHGRRRPTRRRTAATRTPHLPGRARHGARADEPDHDGVDVRMRGRVAARGRRGPCKPWSGIQESPRVGMAVVDRDAEAALGEHGGQRVDALREVGVADGEDGVGAGRHGRGDGRRDAERDPTRRRSGAAPVPEVRWAPVRSWWSVVSTVASSTWSRSWSSSCEVACDGDRRHGEQGADGRDHDRDHDSEPGSAAVGVRSGGRSARLIEE